MKKILIIIYTLNRSRWTEKIATMLGNKFLEKWNDVKFLTFYKSVDKFEINSDEICLWYEYSDNILNKILNFFSISCKIAAYCKNNKIDISFSHWEEVNFHNLFSKLIFKNPAKIFIEIHSAVDAISLIQRFLIKKLYNYTDKIITIVWEERENLISKYGLLSDKIKTINNPVDIENINLLKNEEIWEYNYLFENDKFTFINIARLSPEKNQKILINAFEKFHSKYNESQLIILWDWPLNLEIKNNISKLNSKNDIHLLWNHKNPYKFLAKSDVFLLTSNTEWLPWVILESLALWIPVISTDCKTWPKEIFKENISDYNSVEKFSIEKYWILSPIEDENEFFKAMEEIYKNENLRETLINNSKIKVLEYSYENIMKKWDDLLK